MRDVVESKLYRDIEKCFVFFLGGGFAVIHIDSYAKASPVPSSFLNPYWDSGRIQFLFKYLIFMVHSNILKKYLVHYLVYNVINNSFVIAIYR